MGVARTSSAVAASGVRDVGMLMDFCSADPGAVGVAALNPRWPVESVVVKRRADVAAAFSSAFFRSVSCITAL